MRFFTHMPFTLTAQLATLCKQTHSALALILPISLHITISPVLHSFSWSASGREGGWVSGLDSFPGATSV